MSYGVLKPRSSPRRGFLDGQNRLPAMEADGLQPRKQGGATRIDSLRCKSRIIDWAIAEERAYQSHNQNPLPTDVQETKTRRLLRGPFIHPSNTHHTSRQVCHILDRIRSLVDRVFGVDSVSPFR